MRINVETKFNVGDTAYRFWYDGFYHPAKVSEILIYINEHNEIEVSYVLDGDWNEETLEDDLFTKEEAEIYNKNKELANYLMNIWGIKRSEVVKLLMVYKDLALVGKLDI